MTAENEKTKIAEKAKLLDQTMQMAVHWFEENGTAATARTMREYARVAKTLARTAPRNQAFAVYGESQAGKSYLMGELSAPEKPVHSLAQQDPAATGSAKADDNFKVTWPEQKPVNFIGDDGINPQNNGESSGLVSRFTRQPLPVSPRKPLTIPVRLLSPTDVVSIIGNAFFSDFELTSDPLDLQKDILDFLEPLETDAAKGLMGINEIEILEEYFSSRFAPNAQYLPFKKPDYWNWLKKHVHHLSLPSLVKALSPLWRKIDCLNKYVGTLLAALQALGAPEDAFCGMDALLPSSESILNVKVLNDYNNENAVNSSPDVQLVAPSGKIASLQRYVAAALVSELIIPLSEQRWDFQEKADLLDFPGGRAREILKDPSAALGKEGHLFLRGKVDYLFQLYQDNMETTSTLLCVGEGNQNVKSVPRMIESWVENTIGKTPEQRLNKDVALFFILTKFDTSLKEGDVIAADSTARFDTRINASLLEPYNGSEWLKNWTPGRNFNNTYWLRAPRFGLAYKKDPDTGREIAGDYADSLVNRIQSIHDAHNRSKYVVKYFRDPEAAFNAVMTPNDGGITYLASNLNSLSRKDTKTAQVKAALDACIAGAEKLAKSFYHDASGADEEKKARKEAEAFASSSIIKIEDNGYFGRFLERLIPTSDEIATLWREFNKETAGSQNANTNLQKRKMATMASIFQKHDDEDTESPDDILNRPDTYSIFSERLLKYWREKTLGSLLLDTDAAQRERDHFSLDVDTLKPFLKQLSRLQENCGLENTLATKLRQQCSTASVLNQKGDKVSIICLEELGCFVSCMGYLPQSVLAAHDGRPNDPITKKPIFTIPEEPGLYPNIQTQVDGGYTWMLAWVTAVLERCKELGPSFDPAINAALGQIIAGYDQLAHP